MDINRWLGENKRNSRYGAPMGRRDCAMDIDNPDHKLLLQRVKLDSQGYSNDGTYWGSDALGAKLYCLCSADLEVRVWLRATDRKDAVRRLRETYGDDFKLYKEA